MSWFLLFFCFGLLLFHFGLRVLVLVRDDRARHRVDVHLFDASLAGDLDVVRIDEPSIFPLELVRLYFAACYRGERAVFRASDSGILASARSAAWLEDSFFAELFGACADARVAPASTNASMSIFETPKGRISSSSS